MQDIVDRQSKTYIFEIIASWDRYCHDELFGVISGTYTGIFLGKYTVTERERSDKQQILVTGVRSGDGVWFFRMSPSIFPQKLATIVRLQIENLPHESARA